MNPLDDLLRNRWLRSGAMLLASASAIWLAGPYLGLGPFHPLASGAARALAIAMLAVFWCAVVAWRGRGGEKPPAPSAGRMLRARFARAVATLKRRKLVERPWYLLIGSAGAGKSAWLAHAGFEPSITRWHAVMGDEARRSPSFDVWTDGAAVVFEAEGGHVDGGESWRSLLRLLRHAGRSQLAGIVVVASLADCRADDGAEIRHAQPLRRRLDEAIEALGSLPAYLVFTHADRVTGFAEWFETYDDAARRQVWGATFGESAYLDGRGALRVDGAFERLASRLDRQRVHCMQSARGRLRQARILGFTQQLRLYRDGVRRFTDVVFGARVHGEPPMLRGFYLVSSMHDDGGDDPVEASLCRHYGIRRVVSTPPVRSRRACFGHRIVRHLMLPEAGIARSRAGGWRGRRHWGAIACVAAIAVVAVVAMRHSHRHNARLIARVDATLPDVAGTPAAASDSLREYYAQALRRLDTLARAERTLATVREHPPLAMRLGLFQGDALASALEEARLREMLDGVLPGLAVQWRMAMKGRDPGEVYLALKGHLMLADPRRRDDGSLRRLAHEQWGMAFGSDDGRVAVLDREWAFLLAERASLAAFPLDRERVDAARASLRAAEISTLVYAGLVAGAQGEIVRLDRALGMFADIFRRKGGAPLSTPLPAIHTRAGFAWMMGDGTAEGAIDAAVATFADESWVLGGQPDGLERETLAASVRHRYVADYVATWTGLLDDLQWRPMPDTAHAAAAAARLAGVESPLKAILLLLREHTRLAGGTESAARTAAASAIAEPFAPLHRLVEGESGRTPLDPVLAAFDALGHRLLVPPPDVAMPSQAEAALDAIRVEAARLPSPLAGWLEGFAGSNRAMVQRQTGDVLRTALREAAGSDCAATIEGRYPFSRDGASDVPIHDFATLFGRGGRMDVYFGRYLAAIVDTSRPVWRYRDGAETVGGDTLLIARAAADIRDAWFRGGERPSVEFTLSVTDLPPGVGRVTIDIDGQLYERKPGDMATPAQMHWPGPRPGHAVISLWDGEGHPLPVLDHPGEWGWFRALDSARLERRTDTRFDATFESAGRTVSVEIEANSLRHPFADTSAQRFRCPG